MLWLKILIYMTCFIQIFICWRRRDLDGIGTYEIEHNFAKK